MLINNIIRMIKLKSFTLGKELSTTSDGHTGEEIHDVLMLEQFGFASVPPKGSEGIALMPDGYAENAVTAFLDSPQYKPNLTEGESALYDKFGNSVTLKNGVIAINAVGNLNIVVSGNVTITAPNTTINGNLTVTGTIIN
jgi:phage gp45-like